MKNIQITCANYRQNCFNTLTPEQGHTLSNGKSGHNGWCSGESGTLDGFTKE